MSRKQIITQVVFDRIMRKNRRARKRMARRYLRKAFRCNVQEIGIDAAQVKRFTPLEKELSNNVSRSWSVKTKRCWAKRMKDINKSVSSQRLSRFPPEMRKLIEKTAFGEEQS